MVTLERTSTGGTRRVEQMKRAAGRAMTGAERAEKKRKRASLFPPKAEAQRDLHAERQKLERQRKADEAAVAAAVAELVTKTEEAANPKPNASVPCTVEQVEHDFHRRMILKAAAHERRNEEAAAFWAPQIPQSYENGAFRRVRMRSITVQWSGKRGADALETYSGCDVVFSEHCIWIGNLFHIWYYTTETGRRDGSGDTKAIYSHHAIELCDARVRFGEGCSRHRLTVMDPTAALLSFGDWTATRRMGGYDHVRSFKEKAPYALTDGACKRCNECTREGLDTLPDDAGFSQAARVVMVLEGSAEPQRYKEQMKALMPRVALRLERGIPCTMPLSARRDATYMGDKRETRACVCGQCSRFEPEPEPEPEPEEEREEEEEWDE